MKRSILLVTLLAFFTVVVPDASALSVFTASSCNYGLVGVPSGAPDACVVEVFLTTDPKTASVDVQVITTTGSYGIYHLAAQPGDNIFMVPTGVELAVVIGQPGVTEYDVEGNVVSISFPTMIAHGRKK